MILLTYPEFVFSISLCILIKNILKVYLDVNFDVLDREEGVQRRGKYTSRPGHVVYYMWI